MQMNSISLTGEWRIRPDPGNVGLAEEWFKPPPATGDDHPVPDGAWRPIHVPGAWQHVLGENFHTFAWYQRCVEMTNLAVEWNWPRTRLRFEAVATAIDVWIDGEHVGNHVGDWVPFEFDITEAIRRKTSFTITARVDEMSGHITKGFHDMLSIHHGGIWGNVSLGVSGKVYARPGELHVRADAERTSVQVVWSGSEPALMRTEIRNSARDIIASTDRVNEAIDLPHVELWSPDDPKLYQAHIELLDQRGVADVHEVRFGFRTIRAERTRVLLNNSPLQIRGVLHWGHEPQHLAPAPPPEQIREEFQHLRGLGFNCICLCMWYPPEHFYDIADETGMLIWQQHPVWHAPMDEPYHEEYKRLFRAFMHRDRAHPSAIIVSSTCEHPTYHPDLAAWWWRTARENLPDALLQVQTASFAWSNSEQTDLYDEHIYDNCDRWTAYMRDLQDALAELPEKPFVMGETIIGTSWPDVHAIRRQDVQSRAWSLPACHESMGTFEKSICERYGEQVLARFRGQADRHHLLIRKFQYEAFRRFANHAGLVMNHLRDVPACACGFMDALGTWRFEPGDMHHWLADRVLLLRTPDERRSFFSGEMVDIEILLSNFGPDSVAGDLRLQLGEARQVVSFPAVAPGDVECARVTLQMPECASPRAAVLRVEIGNVRNEWRLWVFPKVDPDWTNICRLDDLPLTDEERAPGRWERGYSRGFGLPVRSWVSRPQDAAELAPGARPWRSTDPIPAETRIILTHRLTEPICDFVETGGRAILLASKARGAIGARYEWLFGQCPLVIERPPLEPGDSDWILDLINLDLTATWSKIIPTEELGLADSIDPIIRLIYTHDQERVRIFDQLVLARLGRGVLAVSSLDHRQPAGRFLLAQLIDLLRSSAAPDVPGTLTRNDLELHE